TREPRGSVGGRDGEDVVEARDRLRGGRWGGSPEPDRRRVRIRRIHVDPGVISAGGQGEDRRHVDGPRLMRPIGSVEGPAAQSPNGHLVPLYRLQVIRGV